MCLAEPPSCRAPPPPAATPLMLCPLSQECVIDVMGGGGVISLGGEGLITERGACGSSRLCPVWVIKSYCPICSPPLTRDPHTQRTPLWSAYRKDFSLLRRLQIKYSDVAEFRSNTERLSELVCIINPFPGTCMTEGGSPQ